jgi:hypothetical protein
MKEGFKQEVAEKIEQIQDISPLLSPLSPVQKNVYTRQD